MVDKAGKRTLVYYKTVPMGFETQYRRKENTRDRYYKTVPMGFETQKYKNRLLEMSSIIRQSLWDLKRFSGRS